MTGELNELGIRVGRLMRQNGIQIIRSRKFKHTTDSDHAFNIAPNLLQQDFTAGGPNQKWPYGGASPAYRPQSPRMMSGAVGGRPSALSRNSTFCARRIASAE